MRHKGDGSSVSVTPSPTFESLFTTCYHIIDPDNHPEVELYFDYIAETIKRGRRRQDIYNPNGYQYYQLFLDLPDNNSHMVVCVRFRWTTQPDGGVREEKFVTTAYFQCF